MNFKKYLFLFVITLLLSVSCSREKQGSLAICFTHTADSKPIKYGKLVYTNSAGNQYQIDEVKYFISKLLLIDAEGKSVAVTQDDGIHYVDNGYENSLRWAIDKIPQRNYTAVSFVFGLDEEDNYSRRFVNPPESNFSWPDYLGGGYHYMQINGWFIDNNETKTNLNIHTGIGQIKDENGQISQFVHNHFTVTIPVPFSIDESYTRNLIFNMEIQRWFETPNLYNFNEFGTKIMQNQHAQELLKENGKNVFEIILDSKK
ncbi:MAG: hypothetical protein LBI45_08255 [Bacteroidales bacterium]|jgi:hypothetical protein|nr:hypothetical protein [Bacteroidales bacterium]